MHYDLTISVPGGIDDAHRIIAAMVERSLVPAARATYSSSDDGRVRIRWERVHVEDDDPAGVPALTRALAELAVVAGAEDMVPHVQLDLAESRRLTQADFDPAEDL